MDLSILLIPSFLLFYVEGGEAKVKKILIREALAFGYAYLPFRYFWMALSR